jgi:Fur family ferric uptake transcriptional regulator
LVRTKILEVLSRQSTPLSAFELQEALQRKKIVVNKTTVYRQIALLQKHALVHEIRLHDRTKRYELVTAATHHHHLVCTSCNRIEDINFKEDIERQEKLIAQQKKFKVLSHSLEFFGVCATCQKKQKPKHLK